MVALAIVSLLIAGIVGMFRGPVVIVEVALPPESSNTDHDIFDIVLTDLIDNELFDPAVGGRGSGRTKKSQIVFGDTTFGLLRK